MMDANGEELAPAVRSILDAAHERAGGEKRVSVDARSFSDALVAAEADGRVPVIAEVKPTSPTTAGRGGLTGGITGGTRDGGRSSFWSRRGP